MASIDPEDCTLSDQAREFRKWVQDPAAFLESCDGGDPGTPDARSIWLMGLEPGWSKIDNKKEAEGTGISAQALDGYSVELQMRWPFNRNAFKLLEVLKGKSLDNYVEFAREKMIVAKGCTGYFKCNLFPQACNNIEDWTDEHRLVTGFDNKPQYQRWMRDVRFPIIKEWIARCKPKLIICAGVTLLQDFMDLTDTQDTQDPFHCDLEKNRKRMYLAITGTVPIAVIPHLSGKNGLTDNRSIETAGNYILESLPGL